MRYPATAAPRRGSSQERYNSPEPMRGAIPKRRGYSPAGPRAGGAALPPSAWGEKKIAEPRRPRRSSLQGRGATQEQMAEMAEQIKKQREQQGNEKLEPTSAASAQYDAACTKKTF